MTDDGKPPEPAPPAAEPVAPAAEPAPPAAESPPPDPAGERLEPDLWDRGAAWLVARGAPAALGVLTLGMMILYAGVFRGELAGDDLSFHMAESARIADCLRAGDFDLWNPSGNAGFASAYYYQVVPQLASAIPAAVFGHHVLFFELSVFLPLVLAPAAAYRGMRLMRATPWQAALAALAIAMLNGESRWGTGNAGTFHVGLYTQTWALAAFPIALGHAVRWATEGRGLASAVAWGAFVTLCHPFAGVSLAVALVVGVLAQLALGGVDRLLAALGRRITGDPIRGPVSHAIAALGERWRNPPPRTWFPAFVRLAILGGCLAVAWLPIWLPLVIDYDGFGGFPHRVADEVGPGFKTLASWYAQGKLLDHGRPVVLTWLLPAVVLFARARFLPWLWAPALVYALWLGLGPHIPKTGDDLIPAVRFLGAMQVVIGLAIGAGALSIARRLWNAQDGSPLGLAARLSIMLAGLVLAYFVGQTVWTGAPGWRPFAIDRTAALAVLIVLVAGAVVPVWMLLRTQYAVRTGIAALAATLGVLLTLPGARTLASQVHVLDDFPGSHGDELRTITWVLRFQPPGRKQVGTGAENHWWNLLSYEYGRRPSLLMMGGGGLQASPNYDFLWTMKDFVKNAWIYDAPYLVFQKSNADKMPSGELVFETRNYVVRRLPSPGLVSPVQVTGTLPPGRKPARAAALDWIKTDLPLADHVLAYDGFGGPGAPPHAGVVRAVRQPSPGDDADIYAEVDVTETTTFIVRESWHPRWRAYIDGVAAPVRRATPDFPAVDVKPGHHVLALRFERPWWVHASWLAWPLAALSAWLVTRRRAAARESPR